MQHDPGDGAKAALCVGTTRPRRALDARALRPLRARSAADAREAGSDRVGVRSGRLPGGPRLRGLPGPVPRDAGRGAGMIAPLDTPEHQLEVIYQTAFDAFLVLDDQRRFLNVSESATTLLGASADTVLTRRLEHFTPQEQWPALLRLWTELERQGNRDGFHE